MLKLVFGILVIQVLMGSLASIISALCIGINGILNIVRCLEILLEKNILKKLSME